MNSTGVDTAATIYAGGVQALYGGSTQGTVISSGGYQDVQSGSVASNTTVGAGGTQYVNATAVNTTVLSGGKQDVQGTASGTTVSNGGLLFIESGGAVTGGFVSSGGRIVNSGGSFTGTLASGAIRLDLLVSSGATVSNQTITEGYFQSVLSGGITSGITVAAYAEQDVYGTANGTVIQSGGAQYIYDGVANGTVILDGGYQVDYASDVGTIISSGGTQEVWGATSNAIVSAGGLEILQAGSIASGTTVLSGGTIVIYDGADVTGLTVSSGGIEIHVPAGEYYPQNQLAPMNAAAGSPAIETALANMIQAMASFNAGANAGQGAFFDTVSAGLLQQQSPTLVGGSRQAA